LESDDEALSVQTALHLSLAFTNDFSIKINMSFIPDDIKHYDL
jgi:hypothetical protein